MRTLALAILAGLFSGFLSPFASAHTEGEQVATAQASPWLFRADWSGGFCGWMSFPLAQDVGYDPSLYVDQQGAHSVLVHNFISHGERRAWFGLIRPLHFFAGTKSIVEISYDLKIAGTMKDLHIIFAAADGRQYSTALPSQNGTHKIRILAAELGLTHRVAMQAVVLRGLIDNPTHGIESQWLLKGFVLHAERPTQVALSTPKLESSIDGEWVARGIVRAGSRLQIEIKSQSYPAEASVYDGAGRLITSVSSRSAGRQITVPVPAAATPGLWRCKVMQRGATTEFRFFVLGSIPEHPRLLLSGARLDRLRTDDRYAELRREIHLRAQTLASTITYSPTAGDNIELMPMGRGIEPATQGELKPYFQLVENYSNAVAYNALDYRLNGNAEALNSARRALLTMAQWVTWAPRRFRSHGLKTYYEVGVITQRLAFGYDLIASELSADEKRRLEQAFWKQAIAPAVEEYFLFNRDPIGASNWMANSLGGALAAAIAVAGDVPEWDTREGPAIAELEYSFEQLLEGLFPGDGSEAEPLGYENFAMQGISWAMSSLDALHVAPVGADRMIRGFWWPYYASVRPGMQLDTGDFNGHQNKLPGFAWTAEHAGIPELRALYDSEAQVDLSRGASVGENGHLLEEMPGPLDLACCSQPAPSFSPPPPSRVFPKRGSAVLRSGWQPDATVISLRAGPWFNHEHRDEGSFQIAAFGQKLVDEAGYASYYTDPHYPDYFTQAAGHNTLLIDGDPFSQAALNGRYWAAFSHPRVSSELLTRDFDYLNLDLTTAYAGSLKSYQREFFFVKPNILVVRDTVSAPEAHVFSWLLHAPPGSNLTAGSARALIAAQKASARLFALGENSQWVSAITPLEVTLFDNLDRGHLEPRRELLLRSSKTSQTQFVVGMNFTPTATEAGKMESWSDAIGEGLRTTNDQGFSATFRTRPGWLENSGLSTDGSALLKIGSLQAPSRSRGPWGWSAIGATVVRQGERVLFRASTPVDVSADELESGIQLTLHSDAVAMVSILRSEAASQIEIDGHSVPIRCEQSAIKLPSLSPGEHHVSIH
ncbi:MAG TPA: heparinase II/III family protein [Terriglobales bacterium]|nr:heparinase II/III family protein [Terriglobales bacterium]